MQSLCQGKGQRSHKAKIRRKHFHGEIGRAISNLVAVLVSDLWAMAGKNGSVLLILIENGKEIHDARLLYINLASI